MPSLASPVAHAKISLLSERNRRQSSVTSALTRDALLTGAPTSIHLVSFSGYPDSPPMSFSIERPIGVELPAWAEPAISSIIELLSLPANWNSYDAPRLVPSTGIAAIRFLADVMRNAMPLPAFVPTSRGGVQLEWHFERGDVEVNFDPAGSATVFASDLTTGQEIEGPLETNQQKLEVMLRQGI